MTVLVVTACPAGLRGHLTRWLLEIAAGVYVGRVSARVRELLWIRTLEMVKTGRAIMVYSADNEQGLTFRVHRHEWTPIDIEGLTLMLRPTDQDPSTFDRADRESGWSAASRRRRFRGR